jgi:hypothetical protein
MNTSRTNSAASRFRLRFVSAPRTDWAIATAQDRVIFAAISGSFDADHHDPLMRPGHPREFPLGDFRHFAACGLLTVSR